MRTMCKIVAVTLEPRFPDVPAKASGDRLQIPWCPSTSRPSHRVPEWLQLVEEGLDGERPDSQCRGGQTCSVAKRETPDDMRVSSEEEPTDLLVFADRSKRPNTTKPTGRHIVFTHTKDPKCEI